MLVNLFGRLFGVRAAQSDKFNLQAKISEADAHRAKGELHEAIVAYEACLEIDKSNVELINSLGACYIDVGREGDGRYQFELAYSLDDSYIPGVANYAKTLIDNRETTRALELLEHVHICEPDFYNIYAMYAALCFKLGDAERARHFYLKAWLGGFDSLRMANAYLFPLSYCGTEQQTASEHRFWAETLRDTLLAEESARRAKESGEESRVAPLPGAFPHERKLRIGYWSPDLRNHSVRFFFRPLLENHDRTKYEVHLYHDCFASDAQTEAMRAACDHFHDVFLLNDVQLFELMRSHQLDILVEMAGHTSANRLLLFKNNRFAALQISGIGYPPTTGLASIDAKLVDRYIATEDAGRHYAEKPMVLPSSFWCYDPMGVNEGVIADIPPADANGYITFACVGNIAKITDPIMASWLRILDAVPESRLAFRAINFEDPNAKRAMKDRLAAAGFDMGRIDILDAEGGEALYNSYNKIDIILDTYPFNGGTTTCFAVYMGVPVISRAGESLISRMGLSAMANLGFSEWVAHTGEEYVTKAIAAAKDLEFLRAFKRAARERFKNSPLGNGAMFAQEFEQACETFLREKHAQGLQYEHRIPALPAKDIMRRAYGVWRAGNDDAAVRILNHCLRIYPDHGGAHLFVAQQMGSKGMYEEAVTYLGERLDRFEDGDRAASVIMIIRWLLARGLHEAARSWLQQAEGIDCTDVFDAAQLDLYRSVLAVCDQRCSDEPVTLMGVPTSANGARLVVLVPCDDTEYFDAAVSRMRAIVSVPAGCQLQFERCSERGRSKAFQTWLTNGAADVLIVIQRVAEVVSPDFLHQVLQALEVHDVISVAGASRWGRSHWRGDEFGCKTAGFMVEARDVDGMYDVQCLGHQTGLVTGEQAVLDGVLLGIRVNQMPREDFDDELLGVGWALEEDWVYRVGQAGAKLAVHRGLGVLVREMPAQERHERYPGLLHLQEKYQFPLFSMDSDDGMVLSAPVAEVGQGLRAMRDYASRSVKE